MYRTPNMTKRRLLLNVFDRLSRIALLIAIFLLQVADAAQLNDIRVWHAPDRSAGSVYENENNLIELRSISTTILFELTGFTKTPDRYMVLQPPMVLLQ